MAHDFGTLFVSVGSAVVLFILAKIYLDYKELKTLRDKDVSRSVEDDKAKIHKKYDDASLDSLVDSSPSIYRKLGPPKDN